MNRKHSRTECKNMLEMLISRRVFEGDINCDCIFTWFFEAPEAGGTANSLEMLILRSVFEGDINCDCIFTGFFEAPEAGGTAGKDHGGTRRAELSSQHFK